MSGQEDVFDLPDETDDGRPSGMRQQRPAKTRKPGEVRLERMATSASQMWCIGVCEGAATYRSRLLKLVASRAVWSDDDLLSCVEDVDHGMRRQFGKRFAEQVEARK